MAVYEINIKGIPQLLHRLDEKQITSVLNTLMKESALDTVIAAKDTVPRYKNNIHRDIISEFKYARQGFPETAIIGPKVGRTSAYARVMEHGRRAGAPMPPWKGPGSIEGWALAHGMNPFLLARSIGRKGIKPRHWLERAKNNVESKVRTRFARAGRMVEQNWIRAR
jgi:hypothetical protein